MSLPAKLSRRGALLLVLTLIGAALAPTLLNGFTYDDLVTVEENLFIRDWGNLKKFFRADYYQHAEEYSYRPLVTLTYFLDWRFWGLDPLGYHLSSLLWHLGAAAALFFLARNLLASTGAAAAATAVFALHPAAVEAVANISFREDLICAFFVLLGAILLLRTASSPPAAAAAGMAALGCLVLALLAKEMAAAFPLLAASVLAGHGGKKALGKKRYWLLGAVLVSGAYAAGRFLFLFQPEVLPSAPEFGPPLTRVALVFKSFGLYAARAVFPVNLTVEYPDPLPPAAWGGAFLGAAFLGTAAGLAAWRFAPALPRGRAARAGLAWFLFALLPVLNLLPSPRLGAERFLYLPLAGLGLWAGALWLQAGNRIKIVGVVVVLMLGSGSFFRARVWKDNYRLFTDAVKKSPASSKAHHGLGNELFRQGRSAEAIGEFERAIAIMPRDPFYYNSLGVALGELGRFAPARAQFEASLRINPNDPTVLVNFAVLDLRSGNLPGARQYIERYLRDRDYDPRGWLILGEIAAAAGDFASGRDAFGRAEALDPGNLPALEGLAYTLYRLGDPEGARQAARRVLEIDPGNPQALSLLRTLSRP